MRLRHLIPFAILLAWQAAPARAPVDSSRATRLSWSLGAAWASFEDYHPAQFDCNGNEVSPATAEAVDVRSVGVRGDLVTHTGWRLTAFAGRTSSPREELAGGFGGFQVAYEGHWFGVGAGLTDATSRLSDFLDDGTHGSSSLYLRAGSASKAHFRLDLRPPSQTFGVEGAIRGGVGFGSDGPGTTSAFLGLSSGPYGSTALFCDLRLPVSPGVDVLLRGQLAPGHIVSPWGLGIGTRLNLGW